MSEPLIQQPKAKPILLSLLTLLSGIAIGIGATLIVSQPKKPDPAQKGLEWMSERIVRHIIQELKLPEQERQALHDKLQPIIQEHMAKINIIRGKAREEISPIFEQMNADIMANLTDEQKIAWQEQIDRMEEISKQMNQRRGRGGRGDGQRRPEDRQWDGEGPPPPRDPNSLRRPPRTRMPEAPVEPFQPQPAPEQP